MARTLTWLHLSDLHARSSDDWSLDLVVRPLLRDLRHMQEKHGLQPDFIFFTGDTAFGEIPGNSLSQQYDLAWDQFFTPIREAFVPVVPVERLFVVPGNHDIDREAAEMPTAWLRAPERDFQRDILGAVGAPSGHRWKNIMARLDAYRAFIAARLPHLQPDDPHLLWAVRQEIHGIPVDLAGFNTSWSCCDDKDREKLWFCADWQRSQAEKRFRALGMPGAANHRLAFALFHHPADWFHPAEGRDPVKNLTATFPVSLHGHIHELEPLHDGSNDHLLVSASSAFQGSHYENGYNFGRIDFDSATVELHLRRWDPKTQTCTPSPARGAKDGLFNMENVKWLQPFASSGSKSRTTRPAPAAAPALTAPTPPPDTPTAAERFTLEYCETLRTSALLNTVQLFGCEIDPKVKEYDLSVSYVSLNLSPEEEEEPSGKAKRPIPKVTAKSDKAAKKPAKPFDNEDDGASSFDSNAASTSESFLSILAKTASGSGRLMIRGAAGMGKSTLLRWAASLAALQSAWVAARGAYGRALVEHDRLGLLRMINHRLASEGPRTVFLGGEEVLSLVWAARTPFLIRLRDCSEGRLPDLKDWAGLARHTDTPAPEGWASGLLKSGQALVLLDGVDEVNPNLRPRLLEEIRELITRYPDCFYLVTTRPAAVERGWLASLHFTEAAIQPMERADRDEFIGKWFEAASRQTGESSTEMQQKAAALRAELHSRPEAARLGSNPLLCGMICGLYHFGGRIFSETEHGLCRDLTRMMVHDRAAKHFGPHAAHFPPAWRDLDIEQKLRLFSDIAWGMLQQDGGSLIQRDGPGGAHDLIARALASTPGRTAEDARDVLRTAVETSLLRQATDTSLDFVHNTFKEYLAALRAIEAGPEFLIPHLEDPAWQPVILFALASQHCPQAFADTIVAAVLRLLSSTPARGKGRSAQLARQIRLRYFALRCREATNRLDPILSRRVSALFPALFPPRSLTEAEALAELGPRFLTRASRTIKSKGWWLTLHPSAFPKVFRYLRRCGTRHAWELAQSLPTWRASIAWPAGEWMLMAQDLAEAPDFPPGFDAVLNLPVHLPRALDFSQISGLRDLRPIACLESLKALDLHSTSIENLRPLAGLRALQSLDLNQTEVSDLSPLAGLHSLQSLGLNETQVSDLSPLAGLESLQELCLRSTLINDLGPLAGLHSLRLVVLHKTKISDLNPLAGLQSLQDLLLGGTQVTDLSPLVRLHSLQSLFLGETQVSDLRPLTKLEQLKNLTLPAALENSPQAKALVKARKGIRIEYWKE